MQKESMGVNVRGNLDTYPTELSREKSGNCIDATGHYG